MKNNLSIDRERAVKQLCPTRTLFIQIEREEEQSKFSWRLLSPKTPKPFVPVEEVERANIFNMVGEFIFVLVSI